MGAVCCCLRDDWEEFSHSTTAICRNCICLHCFVQNVFSMYISLFHQGESTLPASAQGTSSLTSATSNDNSMEDMYRSPPRPLPYDVDPRYIRLQHDGLVSRREKGSSHSHEESEPLRACENDEEPESVVTKNKWNEKKSVKDSDETDSKSLMKLSAAIPEIGFAHIYYTSSEDEDVCPTCLEEYTTENPKILTKCSHHFHLGCIYEWMERSDRCPVCGKVMAFDETTE